MRRSEIFWGGMLIILGGLFFLRTAGYLAGDIFGWFWPLLIMAAGGWLLLGGFKAREQDTSTASFAVPVQGAREARLTVNHGVGRLQLNAGASGPDFLTGNSAAGLNYSSHMSGDQLEVSVDAGPSVFPFIGPPGGVWNLQLNPSIATEVMLHAGASQIELDLTELQLTRLTYEGGASSMKISLPAGVDRFTSHIRTGASSIELRVPDGTAARFAITGPGSPNIDQTRFPPAGQGVFESPDFARASRQAEVTIEGGATSIRIE
jgi:hypothetical protein